MILKTSTVAKGVESPDYPCKVSNVGFGNSDVAEDPPFPRACRKLNVARELHVLDFDRFDETAALAEGALE